MKKILFVFGGEKASGAEFVIERLIRNLSDQECYLLMAPGKYADRLKKENNSYELIINKNLKKLYVENSNKLSVVFNLMKNMFNLNLFVLRFISKQRIDLIHCNTLVPSIYLTPAVLLTKIFKPKLKWVWSDHDLDYAGSKTMMKIAPLMVRIFDKTLVVSSAVLNKFAENLHSKIAVMYNGLDLDEIRIDLDKKDQFRQNNSIPKDALVFGIMGQIVPRKGILNLIKAFNKAFDHPSNVYLVIAGGPLHEDDYYFIECLKTADSNKNIVFTGFLTDISAFYNGIDFLVNNSSKEGSEPLGTTILEGMAYQKTVLVSKVGGSEEIVNHESVGLVYQSDSDSELYKTLKNAAGLNFEQKQKIGEAARSRILNQFEIQKMKENYLKTIITLGS